MKVLLTGGAGQVGQEVLRRVPQGWVVSAPGRADLDLEDAGAAAAAVAGHDAVLNLAAFTAVDAAEAEEARAFRVNAAAPTAMAGAAAASGAVFIHLSTDYVFGGPGPHRPDSPTAPLSAYGRSKLAGEAGIRGAGGRYAILRTSWIFSAHRSNFVRTMLRLGQSQAQIEVVDDQWGAPTPAVAVAETVLRLAGALSNGSLRSGIWHYAGAPDTTWAGFAREICAQSRSAARIIPIGSEDWPAPARRPRDSRLACADLCAALNIPRPDWREGLKDVLKELEVPA
ncbi:dTDP-4-dehydrorhamnose reductase [Halodurantibacterium flavum]|uniref:dTDP-4-dehydrorhamnose reductase n=1 Tax=Halodurantibacterium flavum TaxID=1382802 RepID=A0ABW4S605_9RHOB